MDAAFFAAIAIATAACIVVAHLLRVTLHKINLPKRKGPDHGKDIH